MARDRVIPHRFGTPRRERDHHVSDSPIRLCHQPVHTACCCMVVCCTGATGRNHNLRFDVRDQHGARVPHRGSGSCPSGKGLPGRRRGGLQQWAHAHRGDAPHCCHRERLLHLQRRQQLLARPGTAHTKRPYRRPDGPHTRGRRMA